MPEPQFNIATVYTKKAGSTKPKGSIVDALSPLVPTGYSQTVFGGGDASGYSAPVVTNSASWLSKYLDPAREVANLALDVQMKQALLSEQRDRVSVAEGAYLPTQIDYENASWGGGGGGSILSTIQPWQWAVGGIALGAILLRKK